ncbi:MAG: helix-turn-helix transcriptional regulator [Clostridia bacterium]|nr:helix-turn-helix transcriptional regulator [Clostridia bacterium]
MNSICFAGTCDKNEEAFSKHFEVLSPQSKGKISFSHGTESGAAEFLAENIIIIPPLCRYVLSTGATRIVIEQAFLPVKKITVMRDDDACGVRHSIRQAVSYYNSRIQKKEVVLNALGNLIASYIIVLGGNADYSPAVSRILGEITKNLSNGAFSLDGYIKKLPLNYDYVRKLFKKEVGATPHEYLISKRMELAAELLSSGVSNAYSNYSVSQVAEMCGFAEPLYFSRVFKKYYGVAPSAYSDSLK